MCEALWLILQQNKEKNEGREGGREERKGGNMNDETTFKNAYLFFVTDLKTSVLIVLAHY
jgi:hypothetical protein